MTVLHGSLRFPPSDQRTTPVGSDFEISKVKEEGEAEHKGCQEWLRTAGFSSHLRILYMYLC